MAKRWQLWIFVVGLLALTGCQPKTENDDGNPHTGECEVMGDKLGGISVHIGARVAALANPGEVLVSSTVRDLVAGSGLSFRERGRKHLKGVPGEWRLFADERG